MVLAFRKTAETLGAMVSAVNCVTPMNHTPEPLKQTIHCMLIKKD